VPVEIEGDLDRDTEEAVACLTSILRTRTEFSADDLYAASSNQKPWWKLWS
jgi:uncharacterized phage-associated protein